jgi:IS30 family transposase
VYRTLAAQAQADARAARPKTAKLAANVGLDDLVQAKLEKRWWPEQVSAWLEAEFPGRPGDAGVTETIYQSIYVRWRRALCRELAARLRTGRAPRKPRRTDDGSGAGSPRAW